VLYLFIFLAMHWILQDEVKADTNRLPFPVVQDILMSEEFLTTTNKLLYIRRKLIMTSSSIKLTSSLTSGQRSNPLWAIARKMRLTASNFGLVLAAIKRNRYVTFYYLTTTAL